MPPKRMSDILQSSSIDARISSTPLPTAATDTSDGPSLPIIGATTGTSTKRKRTAAAPPRSKNAAPQPQTNTIHPSLYTPWLLLPAKQRKEIEARGTQALDVLVWSKNQNVKSGISRLLRLVGAAAGSAADEPRGGSDVVVSAQGEGTVKLVGIVDMVRRIAGAGEGGSGEGTKWYVYTVLSSVEVPRARSVSGPVDEGYGEQMEDGGGEAMDVDEGQEGGAVRETQRSETAEMKTVPVLSVWMTRKRMAGWKEVFGEQEMVVHETKG